MGSDIMFFAWVKIVRRDSIYTLLYNDSLGTHKARLTLEQLKVIYDLEKKITIVGSTTHDEYRVEKRFRTIYRARDVRYSATIKGFFH